MATTPEDIGSSSPLSSCDSKTDATSTVNAAELVETITPATTTAAPESRKTKKKASSRLPVKDLFTPWKPQITLPAADPSWGQIPYPADGQEPKSRSDLPPARTSNAQTVPALWEDRKYRFKPGRYHVSFSSEEDGVNDNPDGTLLDQEDNLVIPLIDMRPISRMNQQPRRAPTYYVYENGKPKDWNNAQTLKALNDRRREAIWRMTCDPPWNEREREYLAHLFEVYPNASIFEMAERFNWRFKGDFREEHGFGFNHIHEGRTVESIRNEYLTYKDLYDQGRIPLPKRQEGDKTDAKKVGNRRVKSAADVAMAKFTTLKEWQEACGTDKNGQKRGRQKKKNDDVVLDSDNENNTGTGVKTNSSGPSKLDDELFDLAGGNDTNRLASPSKDSDEHAHKVDSPKIKPSSIEPAITDLTPRAPNGSCTEQPALTEISPTQVEPCTGNVTSGIQTQSNSDSPSTPSNKRSRTDEGDDEVQNKRRMSMDSMSVGLNRATSPFPQHRSSLVGRRVLNMLSRSNGMKVPSSSSLNGQNRSRNISSMVRYSAVYAPSRSRSAPKAVAFPDDDEEDSEMTDLGE